MAIDVFNLRTEFFRRFGTEARIFQAPGRVNLIGEHTDYNGGFVLPMAIDYATTVAAAARRDRKIRVCSLNFSEEYEIDLDAPEIKKRGSWLDFVEGVARSLELEKMHLSGADLLVSSTVPTGAGLSSSAALEIAVGLALTQISGLEVEKIKLALAGQTAEHEFVGAKVGIMDQYISALGEKEHALLIDCRSLKSRQVPLDTTKIAIVICDSNVKHELAASEYNVRRRECEQGVEILSEFLPGISQLRDVDYASFEEYADCLPENIRKRCRHIITENERTLQAVKALENNDFVEFGRLMWLSHESLRDDFEVSCLELDLLVNIAKDCKTVLGARMTGGGFGGSTVNLVPHSFLDEFTEKIAAEYEKKTNRQLTVYISGAADGAGEIKSNFSG